jgi:WD40 repeat protein
LADFLKDMLPEADSELLLVIDQFEEVFTLVETEAQRERFLTSLHKAILELKGRFGVVITLRADYYHRPLLYPGIGELVSQNTQVVLPLTASELAQVVSEPTRRAAIAVSDELVATIVADVSEQPGALPLMEYTLTELFERRQGNLITLQEYEDSGGVSGTLARRANELYESLESDHLKQAARKMFLALVAVGVDTDATRRRARQSDILAFEEDRQLVFDLLDRFGTFRLLTFDREPVSRAPTVEIAHEALISEWALLQGWINSSRDDLRARSRLAAATDEWSRSNREPSYLASGERLSQFDELARRQVLLLNDAEAAYLSSSIALRNRNRFRLRLFVASLIVLTILAIGAALVALERQESAISERDRADLQAQIARSRELAVTALTNLDEQLDLAMLLSVEAYDTSQTYEARRSLLTAIQQEPQLERFMHGHTDGVRSVAFSTDGQLIASASADSTIRLWDAASMQPFGDPLVGHTDLVNSVTFNASGTLLASGSSDGTVRLWEVETGEAVTAPLSADQGAVWSVSFSHDGRWLASGGTDGTIVRWDLASYRMVGEPLVGHQDIVYSVAFSPDNRFLASAGADNTIRLWIANTGLPFGQVLSGHSDWVLALTFSPNGRVLASTGADASILFWDPLRQQQVGQIFTTHTNWIRSLTYIGDFFVVTGSTDGTLRIWDVTTGNMLGTPLGAHDGAVWSVASDPLSARVVSGGVDQNVIVWDLAQSSLLETDVMQQGMPVIDLAISPQSDELVSGGGDLSGNLLENVVMLWNAGEAIQQWPRTTGAVTSVAISPDGQTIAASGASGTIALWDTETGAQITEPLHGHTNVVWAMAFRPDGQWLATASDDQTIILWDVSDGWAIERTLEGHMDGILALAFSPDGKILASGGRDNTVRLWNLESDPVEAQVLSGHLDVVTDLAFNPAGNQLASASRDNTIIVWNVANAVALSRPLARHNDRVLSVAYSPDGQTLASGGQDNQIVLWDVVSLQPMGIISTGNRGQVNSLVFDTSGQRLYSGQQDGSIITWNLNADSWAALACRTAGRILSIEEQISYLGDAGYAPFCTFGVEAPSNES